MKLKLVIAVALITLLLQLCDVNADEFVDIDSSPPPAPACPDEETIANSVIAKMREDNREIPDFSDLDNLEDISVTVLEPLNLSSFSGDANEIISRTRAVMNTPLSELSEHPTTSVISKTLNLVGIDTSSLSLKDTPQIVSCAFISAGGLWDYLSTLHNCISNVIDAKLAKEAPERLAEEKRKSSIESAFQSTVIISKELVSNKTASIFGWS